MRIRLCLYASVASLALTAVLGDGVALAAAPAALQEDESAASGEDPDARAPTADSSADPADDEGVVGVVTGSRLREEVVQDVPIAVSVLNGEGIEQLHTADIRGLSNVVPNLTVSALPAGTGVSIISLRGFSTASANVEVEPGIAVYVDGIYQTTMLGSLTDFFDLDRVEVLRGPQGTLLGKNASAGAILLTRSRPTGRLGMKAHLEYGSYDLAQAQVLVNVPVIEGVLAAKLFGSVRTRGPWQKNVVFPGRDGGAESRQAVRGALLFTPTDNLSVYVTGDYDRSYSSQYFARSRARPGQSFCDVQLQCTVNDPRLRIIRVNYTGKPLIESHSFTANADLDVGGAKLSALTGYKKFDGLNQSDVDMTELTLLHAVNQEFHLKQFSQEIRLASRENAGWDLGGKLSWLIAGYYSRSRSSMLQPIISGGVLRTQFQRYNRDSRALFGHLDYAITDALGISLGIRQSWDEVVHDYTLNTVGAVPGALQPRQNAKFSNLSFEAGAQYELDSTKLLYFRYAEGYRGGGFVGLPPSVAAAAQYDPETTASYEGGLKTEWFNRHLLVNLTAFRTTFNDLQRSTTQVAPGGGSFIIVTDNIAEARVQGLEFESNVKFGGFNLRANAGYIDAKYLEFTVLNSAGQPVDNRGLDFPYAPKWTLSITPSLEIPLNFGMLNSLSLEAKFDYRTKQNVNTASLAIGRIPGYATFDLTAKLVGGENDEYQLSAWVQNATNKHYFTYISVPGAITTNAYDNIGRLFGVALDLKF